MGQAKPTTGMAMMEARELIDTASLGPKALRVIYQAFDDAWAEIIIDYPADQAEAARTRLALALLEVERRSTNSKVLKRMALELMASSPNRRPDAAPG